MISKFMVVGVWSPKTMTSTNDLKYACPKILRGIIMYIQHTTDYFHRFNNTGIFTLILCTWSVDLCVCVLHMSLYVCSIYRDSCTQVSLTPLSNIWMIMGIRYGVSSGWIFWANLVSRGVWSISQALVRRVTLRNELFVLQIPVKKKDFIHT